MLGYMAPWAARRRAWSFTVGDTRYDVAEAEGIKPREAVAVHLKTDETKKITLSTGKLPPEDVKDWEGFVERVVSFLSKPPYNLKYFQPWNEAEDQFTGFWYGGMDEFMETIHLPAARIIRKHGGKVVYGGYPCSGSMQHLVGRLWSDHGILLGEQVLLRIKAPPGAYGSILALLLLLFTGLPLSLWVDFRAQKRVLEPF
jgi:hypothetical protein